MRRSVGTRGSIVTLAVVLFVAYPAIAQQTVGLFVNETPAEGLTLFGPNGTTSTYLINNDGLLVNSWTTSYRPALMGYLLESGHLLRTARLNGVSSNFAGAAGRGGRLEEYDWDGDLVWEFEYSSNDHLSHHDIEPLPNGNVLMIAWDHMTQTDAITAGKNPGLVGSAGLRIDHVIEVEPTPPVGGLIVWEWHARDHLIQDFDPTKDNFGAVGDHPELIDFNFGGVGADWTHANGIDYSAELDQVVISVRSLDEIWVIDHSTSTAEAAGHIGGTYGKGGDLLYRWGNPLAYRRGTAADRKLFGQHDAQWIPSGYPGAGNILIHNNGQGRPGGNHSTVDEIVTSVDEDGHYLLAADAAFEPPDPTWTYVADPPSSFYSSNISGAERQSNGNTLICEGASGHFFEVGPDDDTVWDYVNPVTSNGPVNQGAPPINNGVFKVRRYPLDFPGFSGRDLTPGDPVELFSAPLPVPSESLRATRAAIDGAILDLDWDADTCPSFEYNLIFGNLDDVSTYMLSGSQCGIGSAGGYLWTHVPEGDLYFLIVGSDISGIYESSWGTLANDAERFGTKASFLCGATTKIVTSVCLP